MTDSALGEPLRLSKPALTLAMATYGFIASVLPVWMLLCPRDYLSSYLKIGTIFMLVAGIVLVNPVIHMPVLTELGPKSVTVDGATFGRVVPGSLFPFVFITIACGAISGFHALVSSGTTPKMVDRESDCRAIGYGAMLMEGLVGITALIAASCLSPPDYFAINTDPRVAVVASAESGGQGLARSPRSSGASTRPASLRPRSRGARPRPGRRRPPRWRARARRSRRRRRSTSRTARSPRSATASIRPSRAPPRSTRPTSCASAST